MQLNTLKPAAGSKKKKFRKGRGIGSGNGKTCGHGHKGQTSRSGGSIRLGFEGGQIPLQRRVPKFGFVSLKKKYTAEIRLHELNRLENETVDIDVLKAANLVPVYAKRVKVIVSGKLERQVHLFGIDVTEGAKKVIEDLGGKVE